MRQDCEEVLCAVSAISSQINNTSNPPKTNMTQNPQKIKKQKGKRSKKPEECDETTML
jgi:hypothetical protein